MSIELEEALRGRSISARSAQNFTTAPCTRCCGACFASACGNVGRQLDSVVLALSSIRGTEPLPPSAARRFRLLRCPMALCLFAGVATVGLPLLISAKGWYLEFTAVGELEGTDCHPLASWLMECNLMLPFSSVWFGFGGLVAIGWAVRGRFVESGLNAKCRDLAPDVWLLVDELFYTGLATCACLLLAFLLGCVIVRRTRSIYRNALEFTIDSILDPCPRDVSPGEECIICLEDGGAPDTWRRLTCGHAFHEDCLRTWLRRTRRCPICRRDQQSADEA